MKKYNRLQLIIITPSLVTVAYIYACASLILWINVYIPDMYLMITMISLVIYTIVQSEETFFNHDGCY